MSRIKIVSDGTPFNTHIYNSDGREIKGITEITIRASALDKRVRAELVFDNVLLEVQAHRELSEDEQEDGTPT